MIRKIKKPVCWNVLILLVLCIGALVMLYPFLYMILSSFKFNQEIIRLPPTFLPAAPTLSNYQLVLNENHFARFFLNSVWLTLAKTSIILYSSVFFGYVFSKIHFRGREALFLFVLATMMIPWPVTLVPQYQLMTWFGWVGEYASLIVPSMFSTFGIYMMRQFIGSIPNDLIEAARMDGAGEFTVFHVAKHEQIYLARWPVAVQRPVFQQQRRYLCGGLHFRCARDYCLSDVSKAIY